MSRTILERGTSAHKQIETYNKAREEGAEEIEALQAVVDFLTDETMRGLETPSAAAATAGRKRKRKKEAK